MKRRLIKANSCFIKTGNKNDQNQQKKKNENEPLNNELHQFPLISLCLCPHFLSLSIVLHQPNVPQQCSDKNRTWIVLPFQEDRKNKQNLKLLKNTRENRRKCWWRRVSRKGRWFWYGKFQLEKKQHEFWSCISLVINKLQTRKQRWMTN